MAATHVHVAGFASCGFFRRARDAVLGLSVLYPDLVAADIREFATRDEFKAWLPSVHERMPDSQNHTSSPLVWFGENEYFGGCDKTLAWARGLFQPGSATASVVTHDAIPAEHSFDFDLVVIGGGSGGLACAQAAAKLGARVGCLDFVKPTTHGTTWGLGGTCVNVGCIPKKLMHNAAIISELMHDGADFGWNVPHAAHNWESLVTHVQEHIQSLNFGYRVQLREANVTYMNKLGKFIDAHHLECVDKKGKTSTVSAARFVIAVGCRPTPLSCPGAEQAITSDDLFSLQKAPGKTCVVGAGYVALECAGFLKAFGFDVTVSVRSILLRGFDRECADKIQDHMQGQGIKFLMEALPSSIERLADGRLKVTFANGDVDTFDTVLAAIGRTADTAQLNLEAVGVMVNPANGKLPATNEQTNVPHIYALGDVLDGRPELTPVAIMAGKLLAARLYGGSSKPMDYNAVATTVFTPLEYGTVGLSEDEAKGIYGDAVDSFISEFSPLEWVLSERRQDHRAFVKVVVNTQANNRVIGLHILSPNAGEIIQGFACAFRKHLTYQDLMDTVGIHPTVAEEFTLITASKSSGASATKTSC